MNTVQLKWLAKTLPKRNNKWFAALEQSGLSACSFLYSLVIVKAAGVSELGTYTFWFVMCQFMAMLTLGLATKQMVLALSNKTSTDRLSGFLSTCNIVLVLQVLQVLLLALVVSIYPPTNNVMGLWLGLAFYCVSFNFAELFRQFHYINSRQRQSLYLSAVSLSVGVVGFLLFAWLGDGDALELSVFWFLGAGNLIYVALAYHFVKARNTIKLSSWSASWSLCMQYWKHGVPATGGMLVTWIQNQSITPLLMFMLGPLYVGYYSIARMIVMPVNVVTTGLAKSALPSISRMYGNGNQSALQSAIQSHYRTSMSIVYGYVFVVAVVSWLVVNVLELIDLNKALGSLFVATVLVMMLSNYRFWITQNFVVRMQFGILLRLGIVASCATVCMMLLGGLVFKSAILVVLAPAVGELILIATLRPRLRLFSNANLGAAQTSSQN